MARLSTGSHKHRIIPAIVLAMSFMSLGSGPAALATPPVTHSVATCAQLETLGLDSSTSADTINLTADLDCTGITFAPLYTAGFSGTFDGRGHSIAHIAINQPGSSHTALFSSTNGATIHNVILASGSIIGGHGTGALIGAVSGATTITGVTSHLNITSGDDLTGGLVGQVQSPGDVVIEDTTVTGDVTNTGTGPMSGGSYVGGFIGYLSVSDGGNVTLRRVAYTGDITADQGGSRVGGLVGAAFVVGNSQPASLAVEDSYATGAVDGGTGDNEVGGIVGAAIAIGNGATSTISLTRVYSASAVTGTNGVGGLFGIANSTHAGDFLTITNSFAVGLITALGDNGGLVGANSADPPTVLAVTGGYYDGPGTGQSVCAALLTPTGDCTRINTGTQPGYFKGNHANAPLSAWDFSTVWMTHAGAYPTLLPRDDGDGIDLADEAAGPNAGDANGDDTPDAAQSGVAGFPDPVSGHYAALQSSCGNLFNVRIGAESGTAGQVDVAYDYPVGLVGFVVTDCTPGATATITQYYYGSFDPSMFVMRKWDSSAHSYTTIPGATFTTTTIGGQVALKAVYQITDGSSLDQDGTPDGNIVDPAGPAQNVIGAPNTGLGGPRR